MISYDLIRQQISASVPFARHAGIRLTEIADGYGKAQLDQQTETLNHIGTQHAGALFTLAEAASGAAMAGCFAPMLTSIRPVAASAQIRYLKLAKGPIRAIATTDQPAPDLRNTLNTDGKAVFGVDVTLNDKSDVPVADMRVEWHVTKNS